MRRVAGGDAAEFLPPELTPVISTGSAAAFPAAADWGSFKEPERIVDMAESAADPSGCDLPRADSASSNRTAVEQQTAAWRPAPPDTK